MLTFNFNFGSKLREKFGRIPPHYNLKFLIMSLRICGSWPPINGQRHVYSVWSVFILSISVGHLILAQTAFVLITSGESERIASAMSLLISNYISSFKICVMFRQQRRIQALLDYANGKQFACDDLETMKRIQYKFSTASFVHYAIFQSAGLFACAGWTVSSALHSIRDQNDRVLPMNAWYPFDALATPFYEVTLVFQTIAVVFCCVHNVSMDGLIIGFMAVVGCEFEILKTRLKEIGDNVKEFGATEYLEMNVLRTGDIDEKLCKELMTCVEHHKVIIEYAKELHSIFHFAIFLQFLDNCCVICVTAFALSKLTEYDLSIVLGNLMYLGAIIYQLFLYCYFGNDISIQANFHLKVSLSVIIFMGAWPPRKSYNRSIYMLYWVLSFVFILGIYLFVQSLNLIIIWGDIDKMAAGAFLLMTNTAHALKVFNIIRQQDRIRRLLDVTKSEIFSRHNSKYQSTQSFYAFKGLFHHAAYQSFAAVTVSCWGIAPIADAMAGNDRHLPIEGWYPYNVTKTPAFELTYFHQTAAAIFGCVQNIALDTLVTGLLTVSCCQMEILKSNLSSIGNCNRCSESSEDKDTLSIATTDVENELGYCIEHHNAIIDFMREIEAVFHPTIIVQFLVNCIIICLTAFRMSQIKIFIPAELIGMTTYICCMSYQIFIYCWHGNEIVLQISRIYNSIKGPVQSESVAMAAYSGNWWRCGERYKRGLRLLMARANRPVTLKAGNLLTLSLQTFVSILRASYSFFTVLKSSTD